MLKNAMTFLSIILISLALSCCTIQTGSRYRHTTVEQLEELRAAYERGTLTEEEYEYLKEKVIYGVQGKESSS